MGLAWPRKAGGLHPVRRDRGVQGKLGDLSGPKPGSAGATPNLKAPLMKDQGPWGPKGCEGILPKFHGDLKKKGKDINP